MPILQQQPPEIEATKQIIAASLDPPQDLEYPHAPLPARRSNALMPLVLWSLSLLLGLLMLLVRSPINAPEFEQLTQYMCDPLPRLPNLGNRFQSYQLILRCRAGDHAYVFHSTCGDHTIMYYKNRAATYESTQRFVIALACIVILVSAMGLTRKIRQTIRAKRTQ